MNRRAWRGSSSSSRRATSSPGNQQTVALTLCSIPQSILRHDLATAFDPSVKPANPDIQRVVIESESRTRTDTRPEL